MRVQIAEESQLGIGQHLKLGPVFLQFPVGNSLGTPSALYLQQLRQVQPTVGGMVEARFVGFRVIKPLHLDHGAVMLPPPELTAPQHTAVAGFHGGAVEDVGFQVKIGVTQHREVVAAAFLIPALVAVVAGHGLGNGVVNDVKLGGEKIAALPGSDEMQMIQAVLVDGFPVLQVAPVKGDHGMVEIPRSRFFMVILAEQAGHLSSLVL